MVNNVEVPPSGPAEIADAVPQNRFLLSAFFYTVAQTLRPNGWGQAPAVAKEGAKEAKQRRRTPQKLNFMILITFEYLMHRYL
jgi:hypothetical protein